MTQKTLFKVSDYKSDFGGEALKKKRKSRRPLSSKNAIHLVLRADMQKNETTQKTASLLKHKNQIEKMFLKYSTKFKVKIYKKALASNHIHVLALFVSRQNYVQFIKAISGQMAQQLKIKWQHRPWSRIVSWGKAFQTAIQYVLQNEREALGIMPYQPRVRRRFQLSSRLIVQT